jgi:hypothetical protein
MDASASQGPADSNNAEAAVDAGDALLLPEDDGFPVMIEGLQDPLLVSIYKGLPQLP